jgi:parvulin-like peptidyl-prolyl isomerase
LHDVVSLSQLDPKLAKALEQLPLAEISQPIATSDGLHVVKVLERWPAGPLPFEVRRPAIERELYEEHAALLRMQLRERLDLRYEIRTELDVSEWAKGPGATQEELDGK